MVNSGNLVNRSVSIAQGESKEQFLRFFLVPDHTVLLSVSQLTEVLTIPLGQIVPIPAMPSYVMGVYNWRGKILWMVDLGQLLGLTPWQDQGFTGSSYTTIILQGYGETVDGNTELKTLGLMVNRVEEIEWVNPSAIYTPQETTVSPELLPFMRGLWLKQSGDLLSVLDGSAILSAMPKENNG